jgi:hypothetical protein
MVAGAASTTRTSDPENVLTIEGSRCIFWMGFSERTFAMRTYTIYTQCDHCGVYDRDPQWCTLCQRSKDAKQAEKAVSPARSPRKTGRQLASGVARRP